MDLFTGRPADVQRVFKAALAAAMKACPLSRDQIADQLNELLEASGSPKKMYASNLDRWAAPSDSTHNCPAYVLPLLCRVLGSAEPLRVLAGALGLDLVGQRERRLIELGEAQMMARKARKTQRRALEALEEKV